MIKINRKYYNVLFSFVMAFIMSSIMSLVITVINIGFVENLHIIWVNNWLKAFAVAYPLVLIIVPNVRKLMDKVFTFS